ncbi:hypothetical protein GOP47_0003117 [Adiantum capillus-veneris]|uniref:Uncharacterized protein n=1 Tax=Adiantum capillus-veneris TaxID=13818 RepID=A0A9D4VC57_ADICA|nr:hypothetical protein GOP47_0003117 [Adiantum capillus-veneris]
MATNLSLKGACSVREFYCVNGGHLRKVEESLCKLLGGLTKPHKAVHELCHRRIYVSSIGGQGGKLGGGGNHQLVSPACKKIKQLFEGCTAFWSQIGELPSTDVNTTFWKKMFFVTSFEDFSSEYLCYGMLSPKCLFFLCPQVFLTAQQNTCFPQIQPGLLLCISQLDLYYNICYECS